MQPRLLLKTSFTGTPSLAFLLPQQLGLKGRAYAVSRPLHTKALLYPLVIAGQVGGVRLQQPTLRPYLPKQHLLRLSAPAVLLALIAANLLFVASYVAWFLIIRLFIGLVLPYLSLFLKPRLPWASAPSPILDKAALPLFDGLRGSGSAKALTCANKAFKAPLYAADNPLPSSIGPLDSGNEFPALWLPAVAYETTLNEQPSVYAGLGDLLYSFKSLELLLTAHLSVSPALWEVARHTILIQNESCSQLGLFQSHRPQLLAFGGLTEAHTPCGPVSPATPSAPYLPWVGVTPQPNDLALVETTWLWSARSSKKLA